MASVTYSAPVTGLHGKLKKKDRTVFRTRNGVQQAYALKRHYNRKPTELQAPARAAFSDLAKQVKAIYANPVQLAEWTARWEELISSRSYKIRLTRYLKQQQAIRNRPIMPIIKEERLPKPPTTLYGFIMSSLAKKD